MRLKSIEFTENEDTAQEWVLEGLTFGTKNLIVGRNASGKTRALNVISALAKSIAGARAPSLGFSSKYDCHFEHNSSDHRYEISYKEGQVVTEKLTIDGTVKLNRGSEGEGTIFAEDVDGGKNVRFQPPSNQFAVATRRDAIQHKFLELTCPPIFGPVDS